MNKEALRVKPVARRRVCATESRILGVEVGENFILKWLHSFQGQSGAVTIKAGLSFFISVKFFFQILSTVFTLIANVLSFWDFFYSVTKFVKTFVAVRAVHYRILFGIVLDKTNSTVYVIISLKAPLLFLLPILLTLTRNSRNTLPTVSLTQPLLQQISTLFL